MAQKLIYNVTIKITWAIQEKWVTWMKQQHIPALMETKCFEKYTFAKLIDIEEDEGPTYTCQYVLASRAQFDEYEKQFSTALRKETIDTWGNQFIAFRTLMEVVD